MICHSGAHVYPDGDGVPTLEDIGIGLGRQARWAGQVDLDFPVLAHALCVVEFMPEEYAIFGLLHDAPEAIMSDVPTPWKCDEFKELEHRLYERIARHYGLPWPIPPHVQAAVDKADYEALVTEAYVLGHREPEVMHRGGPRPSFVNEYAPIVDKYRREACRVFVSPEDPEEATLAFREPQIAGRLYAQAFEHLMSVFDAGE